MRHEITQDEWWEHMDAGVVRDDIAVEDLTQPAPVRSDKPPVYSDWEIQRASDVVNAVEIEGQLDHALI